MYMTKEKRVSVRLDLDTHKMFFLYLRGKGQSAQEVLEQYIKKRVKK